MDNKNKSNPENEKTATNNQWISTEQNRPYDKTQRKDGPGGENAK